MDRYIKNKKIKLSFREEIEPHEILVDSLAQKRQEGIGVPDRKFEVPILKRNLYFLLVLILGSIFILFFRDFYLQVVEGKQLSALAERNRYIVYQLRAVRGVIYDRNFKQLVSNQPSFDLVLNIKDLPTNEKKRELILKEVSGIIKADLEELQRKIKETKKPEILVYRALDRQTLLMLETKISQFPGFQIKKSTVRNYISGKVFCHLIGYKRRTGEMAGLEKYYDDVLRAKEGKIRIERDARGNVISQKIISLARPGKSLLLWVDADLQKKVQEALLSGIKKAGSKSGAAVAIDPKTGGILALVSIPEYDNNLFSKGMTNSQWKDIQSNPLRPLFNRVVEGRYLTGSTIKPLIASAALQEKIISPEKKIYCKGKISVPDRWNPKKVWEYNDWKIHGWTDIRKAIAESCNVYFYTIGGGYKEQKGLGPSRIKKYLELFGWGEKTGIDLPGEAAGFIPDKEWKKKTLGESWWDGDTYYLSIGQQYIRITPLEVVRSFAAIANGGKILEPHIVKAIIGEDRHIIKEIEPKIIREGFIDPDNLKVVREGMRQAVTSGSAVLLNDLRIKAAAKTGTAETGREKDGEGIYHNWITVFAPYDDPQIVLTVLVENVKGVKAVVQPIAKEILKWYFNKGTVDRN